MKYPISVDYSLSMKAMIDACKLADDAYSKLPPDDNFLLFGRVIVPKTVTLLSFEREMKTNDIIIELEKINLRPVNIEEFLSFAATYPDVLKQNILVCLGYKYGEKANFIGINGRGFPVLSFLDEEHKRHDWENAGAHLELVSGDIWAPYVHFVAVEMDSV